MIFISLEAQQSSLILQYLLKASKLSRQFEGIYFTGQVQWVILYVQVITIDKYRLNYSIKIPKYKSVGTRNLVINMCDIISCAIDITYVHFKLLNFIINTNFNNALLNF